MLRVFNTIDGKLKEDKLSKQNLSDTELAQHIHHAKWVDLLDPTDQERDLIESINVSNTIPDSDDVEEIESTARYFINKGNIHIHSLFLHHVEGTLKTVTVAFILKENQLLTFRDVELADFRLLRLRTRQNLVQSETPSNIMIALLEQKIEDLADALEDIYKELEEASSSLAAQGTDELEDALELITHQEDENGKVRMCLMDTRRSITYLQRHLHEERDFTICLEMLRDIETLMGHTQFLFDKVNFLMNAAQGFINIKQNKLIKTVSAAAVIFMPPTLITGMYGMNFDKMPELHWMFGYPFAQGLMLASAILTAIYFKRKKLF